MADLTPSSVTARAIPPVSWMTRRASSPAKGFSCIRVVEKIGVRWNRVMCACPSLNALAIGAQALNWTPISRGILAMQPMACSSWKPLYEAMRHAALPRGKATASGGSHPDWIASS